MNDFPYLVLVSDGSRQLAAVDRHFVLDGKDVLIGSDPHSDIVVSGSGILASHVHVFFRQQRWHLKSLTSTLSTSVNGSFVTHWVFRKDGDSIRLGEDVHLKFYLGSTVDSDYHRQMHQRSITDTLTGVYNRRYFDQKLADDIDWCLHRSMPLSLLLIDVDHFKKINDVYSHAAGDAVLKELAHRVTALLRKEKDTFARWGGEEFAMVLPNVGDGEAMLVAERVRGVIAQEPVVFQGASIPVTVSIGLVSTWQYISVMRIMELADKKLYQAKSEGRNRVVV